MKETGRTSTDFQDDERKLKSSEPQRNSRENEQHKQMRAPRRNSTTHQEHGRTCEATKHMQTRKGSERHSKNINEIETT